jgi:hypothetical protein
LNGFDRWKNGGRKIGKKCQSGDKNKQRVRIYVRQGCQMVYFSTKNPNLHKF